jgi:hypothetical protein
MGLLDFMVSRAFRDEKAGRVVVFSGDRRGRGYIVKSEAEESKIRSFLKMFYSAHIWIIILGNFLALEWSRGLNYELGRPALHMYRTIGIAAAIYWMVAGVPYLLLWRSYKKAFASFTAGQEEVTITGPAPGQGAWVFIALGVLAIAIMLAIGLIFLVQAK